MFIIGGQNSSQIFYEVLIFDFANYESISIDYKLPAEIIGFSCGYKAKNDNLEIKIVGGITSQGFPFNQIININITKISYAKFLITETIHNNFSFSLPSYSTIIRDSSWIHIIGGVFTFNIVSNLIISINFETSETHFNEFSKEFGLFSHTAVQVLDQLYIFGGVKGISGALVSTIGSSILFKYEFDDKELNLSCLNGEQSKPRKFCKLGTYYSDGLCLPCGVGTYSDIYGASSIYQCKKCRHGTFNNRTGASFCKDCPYDMFCPIGSSLPKNRIVGLKNESLQPKSWTVDSHE